MPDELEKKFIQAVKDMFDNFVKENIGYKKGDKGEDLPDCFGSGDSKSYCMMCPYRGGC